MVIKRQSGLVRTFTIIYLFVSIFWAFYSLRFYKVFHGKHWLHERRRELYTTEARRFRVTAVELGGLLIKLGQFFSTRVDMLPPESIKELSSLQDEVKAESFAGISAVIEEEFNSPLEQVFLSIEEEATASASLGQVHRGVLKDGSVVAIKVQRPGIDMLVNVDLNAIAKVVALIKAFTDWDRVIDLDAIYKEFADTIRAELDYIQEGHNAETIAANLAEDQDIIIPVVNWEYTRHRVLTMEYLEGIKITETRLLQAADIDCSHIAEKLLETYVKQVLIDGFYHADPHPGNLFVSKEGKIILLDFGMVGTITPEVKTSLVDMSLALVNRDFGEVLRYLQELGFIRYNSDNDALIRAMGIFVEHFLGTGKDVAESDLKRFLQDLEILLYEQPFQIPANYTFLGRALGTLYGICIGLDENISFIDVARPYVDRIVPGKTSIFNLVKDKTKRLGLSLIELPPLAESVLRKAERGDLNVNIPLKSLGAAIDNNTRANKMVAWAIVFGFSLLGSIYLLINGWNQAARYCGGFTALAFLIFIMNNKITGGRKRKAPHPPVIVKRGSK